jgi:hypothetical protein
LPAPFVIVEKLDGNGDAGYPYAAIDVDGVDGNGEPMIPNDANGVILPPPTLVTDALDGNGDMGGKSVTGAKLPVKLLIKLPFTGAGAAGGVSVVEPTVLPFVGVLLLALAAAEEGALPLPSADARSRDRSDNNAGGVRGITTGGK